MTVKRAAWGVALLGAAACSSATGDTTADGAESGGMETVTSTSGADASTGGPGGSSSGEGVDGGSSDDTGPAPVGDIPGALDRDEDPVVVLGAQLGALREVDAGDVVAFARVDGGWSQVPVQVDERAVKDFCEVYGENSGLWNPSGAPPCGTDGALTSLVYTDSNTFTGPDPQPQLDDDDEVVFMAQDAGDRVGPWAEPEGVVAGSGVELELADGDDRAYIYLFERDGKALQPSAGRRYVEYAFALADGIDYDTNYDLYGFNCGGDAPNCNPSMTEDSTVQTASYTSHFAARWVGDELTITTEGAPGVDILDIRQGRFGPDTCARHVLTYSTSRGAYVANKNGPVRAIRSVIGANSGPLTMRTHRFYEQREDIVTNLRVHALGVGIMAVFDYSPEAIGMTYFNDLNPQGLLIDGVPDEVDESGVAEWEMVTGDQGTLVMTGTVDTSLNTESARFFWADDVEPDFLQCDTSQTLDAPDASAYGTSGTWFEGALPNTDPRSTSDHLMFSKVVYVQAPNLPMDDAMRLVEHAREPIAAFARAMGDRGTGESCGDGICGDGESCTFDCAPVDGSCGDTICETPETSTTCPEDCPGGKESPTACGDTVCDPALENQLLCTQDCWPAAAGPLNCIDNACESLYQACADEDECVALVVCVAPCLQGGGEAEACLATCSDTVAASPMNAEVADGLLACGTKAGCL
ncbi:MAG: hypothetical protein AAGA54_22860 [Myxococcota bacterium]